MDVGGEAAVGTAETGSRADGTANGDTLVITGGEVAGETADIVMMDAEDKVSENKGGDVIGGEGMGDIEIKRGKGVERNPVHKGTHL